MSSQINRIETILKDEYTTENFVEFIREIFDSVNIISPNKFHEEIAIEDNHIVGYSHIGDYFSPEKDKISVFSVELGQSSFVENSRSIQRNYARKLIEAGNCDAAIIAFYTTGDSKWRISFVRLDYEMKFENGKFSTVEEITPAKRYSFLVGPDEPCHTAISRFFSLIINKKYNPSLDEIEDAFSVEKLTKEFFSLYCDKFYQLQEYLSQNSDFIAESNRCGFTSEQFAKKLMGQIVFLYFLQKKRWLGVDPWPEILSAQTYNAILTSEGNATRGAKIQEYLPIIYRLSDNGNYVFQAEQLELIPNDAELLLANHMPLEKTWGDGAKNFLRKSFDYSQRIGKPFYEHTLKPILYDALNRNRGGISYCPALHCRIPFLSSGLFEPIDNYDWLNTHFDIPDEIFSNRDKNKHYDADGILDIFDRYNFTICEEEPMEREVAIDPEMLGKVFENLLEVKDRKSKGAFYTPREIVNYMCREGLINYLCSKLSVPQSDIRDFVLYGDFMKDEDTDADKRIKNVGLWISERLFELDCAGKIVTNRLLDVDDALAKIKILDPAVGSGAFPLCFVNEIVRLRQIITAYLTMGMSQDDKITFYQNGRTAYWLKYYTIKNCIYAVDIEPSAVDIAQLRLWLSLVIDADVNPSASTPLDGTVNPMPLPNLENNILCANSLVNECEGVSPFCTGSIISCDIDSIRMHMQSPAYSALFNGLFDEQSKLFACDDPIKKIEIKRNINSFKAEIFNKSTGASRNAFDAIEDNLRKPVSDFTLWQIDFAKVFIDKGGFDLVVGNPPYVQLQKALSDDTDKKVGDQYSALGYRSFAKSGDMYCLFYELGVNVLRKGGHLVFITSNKWLRTAYGTQLRTYFASKTNPKILIDFSGTRVFETAGVDVNILLTEKANNIGCTKVCTIKEPCGSNLAGYIQNHSAVMSFSAGEPWNILPNIEEQIKSKILKVGKPIADWKISIKYGIKTCLNKLYVIDEATKRRLCQEDPASEEILSPVLRGRDINKWECNYRDLWLVAVHNGIHKYHVPPVDIDKYPAVKNYLTPHMDALKKKIDQGITPYHLKNCTYYEEYSLPKIVFQEIEQSPSFALDSEGKYMCVDTVRIITGERLEYLTGLLNSNLFFFAVKHFFGGGTLGETGVRMKHTFFKAFTAYVPTDEEAQYIKEIVLSKDKNKDDLINEFFYEKYGIDSEEISYIESDIKQVKK